MLKQKIDTAALFAQKKTEVQSSARTLLILDGQENAYILDDLFIDARYQGRGYGTAALALILEGLRREGKFPRVILCYVEGNDAARKF